MQILVTGGAGFIGSALAARLVRDGHEVVVIDDFNEYYDASLKRAREKEFLGGCTVVEGSITNAPFLEDLFSRYRFDVVCHLAAQAGVRYSIDHPEVYVETNVHGTQLLLEAMRKAGVLRMVFASTSSVYGNTTTAPFTEREAADRPVSIYAATKRSAELIAHTYSVLYGMDVTCLRFFTVYGPWSRPDMAMLKFAEQIMKGEPIDIYNNGELRRDFTYVGDIVDGFVSAILHPMGYEIINLGNGSPVALIDFIDLLEAKLGKKAERRFLPMQEGDVYETYADITKAREKLGFAPHTTFDVGVQAFVDWFKAYKA